MAEGKETTPIPSIDSIPLLQSNARDGREYWRKSLSELHDKHDVVLIHVCDENRQTTKDFCCKRNILVRHMKYFEGFLAENENGYDDIDISVHCDVDIFEWLMQYIHSPDDPPPFDKCLVVSILISSDFLQMNDLVDLCLAFVSQNMSEITKLPIDLSCVSEKLLNKLAVLTPSSVLARTRDRKDKILNKLYKRRVELDFSRKSGPRSSIASSLTCCRNCHTMFLENYASSLVCRKAETVINFRGVPVRRHVAIPGWSLTSYLKSLHSNGLNWEHIYWHVWGACILFRINSDVVFSASESYRYNVMEDGLSINTQVFVDEKNVIADIPTQNSSLPFSLYREDDFDCYLGRELILRVEANINSMDEEACDPNSLKLSGGVINKDNLQSGLNPHRRIDILPGDIFHLISSQRKLISGEDHLAIIENVCRQQAESRIALLSGKALPGASYQSGNSELFDFSTELFGSLPKSHTETGKDNGDSERTRGRTRSRSQVSRDSAGRGKGGSNAVEDNSDGASLRSRSYSGGPRRSGSQANSSNTSMSRSQRVIPTNAKQHAVAASSNIGGDETSSERTTVPDDAPSVDPFATLRSIPPEVKKYFGGKVGPIDGIWLTPHPLSLLPPSYHKTLSGIKGSKDLSQNKRNEWELDLLREYDDTRMEKYEEFLLRCRRDPEKQLNKFVAKQESGKKDPKEAGRKKGKEEKRG